MLGDGTLVAAEPFVSARCAARPDLLPATAATDKEGEEIVCQHKLELSPEQARDLLMAWYVNFNVRSNGVVIASSVAQTIRP